MLKIVIMKHLFMRMSGDIACISQNASDAKNLGLEFEKAMFRHTRGPYDVGQSRQDGVPNLQPELFVH